MYAISYHKTQIELLFKGGQGCLPHPHMLRKPTQVTILIKLSHMPLAEAYIHAATGHDLIVCQQSYMFHLCPQKLKIEQTE